ncbi:hypothetical protein [Rhodococcoides corynebacterioides]|uniref:Uncharacterized protein n=1 Tax=Rhodococcoides corynebacterioides TaxID=53972 RepID=A0ABS7P3I8_9NOCA|nr:hypothetical protein [Rhodococcus corynebacterioides]MBY6366860.1 hypothetical protein [Rhodococcus corynebacterioides]MBY6409143.1 hypothetical protein [Rhodococcus corynebacterioides]
MSAQAWVTLTVGVLAVVGVAFTVRQRTIADKRSQAWQRITWCLDHTLSDKDDEAELGWDVYATVTDSPLITATERDVLRAVSNRSARALAQVKETGDTGNWNDPQEPQ